MYQKYIKFLILLIVIVNQNVSVSQPVNTITRFQGGRYRAKIQLAANLLNDFQSPVNEWNNLANISTKNVWGNPAHLAALTKHSFSIEWMPGYQFSLGRIFDINQYARDYVDQIITRFNPDSKSISYPNVDATIRMNGQFGNFAFTLVSDYLTFAIGYQQSMHLSLNMFGSGQESTIQAKNSIYSEPVIFNNFTNLALNSQLTAQQLSFGIARNLHESWDLGLSVTTYFIRALADGTIDTQGGFYYLDAEYFFNDPEANWRNDFTQRMNADYRGQGIGFKSGGVFHPSDSYQLDLFFEYIPKFTITGNLDIIQNKFRALNEAALFENGGGNLIRPEKLDETRLTYTYPFYNQIDNSIIVRLPSQVSLGGAIFRDNWTIFSRMSLYFREMSLHYLNSKAGLRPYVGLKLGFAHRWFTVKSGFIIGKKIRAGLDKHINPSRPKMTLPVPMLVFSRGYQFQQEYQVEGALTLLPIPGIKLNFILSL